VNPELAARFAADLDSLVPGEARIGLAISGGPDSLALLVLAAAARPGAVEAATVDHGLRDGSSAEAELVARVCAGLEVPHATLPIAWPETPQSNLQARAREARYSALAAWAAERGLAAIATAHHVDDQAETLLMRLGRGAGLSGLAGVRRRRPIAAAASVALVRPLLGWRRDELRAIVQAAGLQPAEDPANSDPRHDRTRVRALLASPGAPDASRIAASAAHLADAEEALNFAAAKLYQDHHRRAGEVTLIEPGGMPREIKRRMLLIALQRRGAPVPRGPELMRLIGVLERGGTATLGGFKLQGGKLWRLSPAPPRKS
jgi:tRNA(Ile)-lysidine synthase